MINFDLENYPLYIKTDSVVGSDDLIWMYLYNAQGEVAGAIKLLPFQTSPEYFLRHCTLDRHNFPTALPSETDKVWKITLTRTSAEVRLVIHCNDVEVLNVLINISKCNDWRDFWSRKVEKIDFLSADTASDFYSFKPVSSFTPGIWFYSFSKITKHKRDEGVGCWGMGLIVTGLGNNIWDGFINLKTSNI